MIKLLVPTSTKKVHLSKYFAFRPQKRGGILGTGTGGGEGAGGRGGERPTRKTEEAVDRRQNNQNVKAGTPNDDDDDELMLNVLRCHETY